MAVAVLLCLTIGSTLGQANSLSELPTKELLRRKHNSYKEQSNMRRRRFGDRPTTPPVYSPEHATGSKKLKFDIFPGTYDDVYLKVDTPSTYRVGISHPLAYLQLISVTGDVPYWYEYGIDFEFINTEAEKVKTIFTTERFNHTELDGCCSAIHLFYLLGRLEELNTSKIVEKIKSYQIDDGGFLAFAAGWADPFSSIYQTWWAVQALALVGEKPRNSSAVRDFLVSMQDTTSIYETTIYEFKMDRNNGAGIKETKLAFLIAKTLGFELPHLKELQAKVEKEYAFFMANHSKLELDDCIAELYHLVDRTYMLNKSRAEEMRKTLAPIAWELHNSLPEGSYFLRYTAGHQDSLQVFLQYSLVHLGRANPKLECYLKPNKLNATTNETTGELVVVNSSPLRYPINLTKLEVLGEGRDHYAVNLTGKQTFTLLPQQEQKIALSLKKTSNKTDSLPSKLEVKLTLEAPTYCGEQDRYDYQPVTAQYYFTVNITQEEEPEPTPPTPTPSGAGGSSNGRVYLAVASSIGAAAALGGTMALMTRKRRED